MKILRTILFILNVLLALGLIATTLAGIVSPSRSILPSLLAFGYVPLLLANVVMVVVWLLMGRWEMLLSVAAIAMRWSLLPLFIQAGGTSKAPSAEEHPYMTSVMTYNVRQFRGPDSEAAQPDSIAQAFIGLVRSEAPDVLCLQEYAAVRGLKVTDSLVLMGYNHYYGAHTATDGTPYGTVVFSRLPITFVKRLDAEKVLVELLNEGQRMRVVCLHMDSYRFDEDDLGAMERMRHGEMQEDDRRTMGKIKETVLSHEQEWNKTLSPVVAESTAPTLMAGDLNDIPSSWLYHQIHRSMKDCYTERGTGFSTTYSLARSGVQRMMLSFRIDMVFHNDGLRTLSYRRIKTRLSDHYPVMVTVEPAI